MELPKLVYDDFYKFLMSLGVILFITSLGLGVSLVNNLILGYRWIFIVLCVLAFILGILIMIWAGKKWYKNQKLLDKKLESETALVEHTAEIELKKEVTRDKAEGNIDSAMVTYKIAAAFPELNTLFFNFLKDWKVWFLIKNHEIKKYKAYVKIKFISDGYEEETKDGYYGGIKAWNLNALATIIAPGLNIPEKIKEGAKQEKKIEIRIFCEIKDENDNLIEKKLPVGYVYDYKDKSWYYEP
jgi:hypothetical protein